MLDVWTFVRFVHVLGAVLWVGGQLTISAVLLPIARRRLDADARATLMRTVGKRFGVLTLAAFVPLQVATGVALAARHGVTWASLAEPGYGRTLAAKLVAFVLVMLAAALHGILTSRGRADLGRVAAIASLAGSLTIVLLATALATHP